MSVDNLLQDLRYAVRSYAKAPSFTLTILLTLALGIGASTAIFSMVNAILLRPLPLPDPDTLVYANEISTGRDKGTLAAPGVTMSVSWPNYLDWRARAQSFSALALTREEPLTLAGVDRALRLRARRVTGNFFAAVGVAPALGRGLTDADDTPGAPPVAVVSAGFWQTQMGGDPSVLGRTLKLDGTAFTVVGVLPPGFEYLRQYDVFASMGPISGTRQLTERGNHSGFSAVGRLKPGVSLDTADSELKTIASALEREYPGTNSAVNVITSRLADRRVLRAKTLPCPYYLHNFALPPRTGSEPRCRWRRPRRAPTPYGSPRETGHRERTPHRLPDLQGRQGAGRWHDIAGRAV